MANTEYILMLESDSHDRELSKGYFDKTPVSAKFLNYSHEPFAFLEQCAANNQAFPAIILLSMHSVPDNGLDVLKQIKGDKRFKHIPVIILGENTQPGLIKECYHEGANTFINKPFTNKLTDTKIIAFLQYWLDVAELPSESKLQFS